MKWSGLATLVAAPLALASTLQADLVERKYEKGMDQKGSYGGGYGSGYGSGSSTVIVEEIVVVWVCDGGGSKTSTINTVSSAMAAAATHTVIVGGSAGLVYTPNSLSANIGDMVIFTFMSENHTVTQSNFGVPCKKIDGGFDSDFKPNPNNTVYPPPQVAMQVKVSTPLWFYCRQKTHCGKGMTFSINPTANKTQADFEQMAIAQNGTGTTAAIVATAAPVAATTMATVSVAATSTYAAPPPSETTSGSGSQIVSGSGSGSGDACYCSCFCGVAQYPSAVQGLAGYGGMSGSIPMAMAMS